MHRVASMKLSANQDTNLASTAIVGAVAIITTSGIIARAETLVRVLCTIVFTPPLSGNNTHIIWNNIDTTANHKNAVGKDKVGTNQVAKKYKSKGRVTTKKLI